MVKAVVNSMAPRCPSPYPPSSTSAVTLRITGGTGEGQSYSYRHPYSLVSGKEGGRKKRKKERREKSIAYGLYREQVKVYIHSQENPNENRKEHSHPSAQERARGRSRVHGRESIGTCTK